jgi:hypothetical protein
VISNYLDTEDRFRTPELMAAHGVRRAMNVILQGDGGGDDHATWDIGNALCPA